jgi:HAD superfamily hydrolase (TIGR01509 family)
VYALIFDFDGLILETETPYFLSWQEVYQEYGLTLSVSDWGSSAGNSSNPIDHYARLAARVGYSLDRDQILAHRYQRQIELVESQDALPGVVSLINEAKQQKMKLAVASSSSHLWVVPQLTRIHLIRKFDCIKCKEDVASVKPDPELYNAVLRELQLQASQAIAFEDSLNGVLAAKEAGLFCVAVPNSVTCYQKMPQSDLLLNSLANISLSIILEHVNSRVRQ